MSEGQASEAEIKNIAFSKSGKLIPRYIILQITKF